MDMLNSGERQVAPTLDGIRADHVARYEWVAKRLARGSWVIDYGCGVGYGARILAEAGHRVVALDADAETIAYAREHYAHENISFVHDERVSIVWSGTTRFDAAICFEVIEHIADPAPLLRQLREHALTLYASVPNEDVLPWRSEANGFKGYAFHHRHYRPHEFADLLKETGWTSAQGFGQLDAYSPVEEPGPREFRTLIAVAERGAELAYITPDAWLEPPPEPAPEPADPAGIGHVVILGLGPSLEQYLDLVKRLGGRRAFADQVWAINALGDIVQCDLTFHMDDVRVQELRAAAAPQSNIARMVEWLKTHPGPVMTSRAHPDYPGLIEFPLEDVINTLGYAYFNGTAAYAAAYAIYRGATKISLFGCDYTMANSHHAEKGRACLEFWLGYAAARGIELGFADRTTLMDTCDDPTDPGVITPYGFDFDTVRIETVDGSARITLEPRDMPPTAAEIEDRYDHTRPTVSLRAGAKV